MTAGNSGATTKPTNRMSEGPPSHPTQTGANQAAAAARTPAPSVAEARSTRSRSPAARSATPTTTSRTANQVEAPPYVVLLVLPRLTSAAEKTTAAKPRAATAVFAAIVADRALMW